MFSHVKQLQFDAKPDQPDPMYARPLQELLVGKFGEMTVMMSYLFQGWNRNSRGPRSIAICCSISGRRRSPTSRCCPS